MSQARSLPEYDEVRKALESGEITLGKAQVLVQNTPPQEQDPYHVTLKFTTDQLVRWAGIMKNTRGTEGKSRDPFCLKNLKQAPGACFKTFSQKHWLHFPAVGV